MDPGISEALGWLSMVVHVLLAVGLAAVAFVRLRPTSPSAAYLLAAAGGADALGSCCLRGFHTFIRARRESMGYDAVESMYTTSFAVSMLVGLVTSGLIIAGLVVAARAITHRRTA